MRYLVLLFGLFFGFVINAFSQLDSLPDSLRILTIDQAVRKLQQLETAEETERVLIPQKKLSSPHFTAYRTAGDLFTFKVGYVGCPVENENRYYLENGKLIRIDFSGFSYDHEVKKNLQSDSRYQFYYHNDQPIAVKRIEQGTEPYDSLTLTALQNELLERFTHYSEEIQNSVFWKETDQEVLNILMFALIMEQGIEDGHLGWAGIEGSQEPTIGSFGIPNRVEKIVASFGKGAESVSHNYYLQDGALLLYVRSPHSEEKPDLLQYQEGREYCYFAKKGIIRRVNGKGESQDLNSRSTKDLVSQLQKDLETYIIQLRSR